MRVYLDTNVYGRPFDCIDQQRIRDEVEVFLDLLIA
jgi:hypothetical protein